MGLNPQIKRLIDIKCDEYLASFPTYVVRTNVVLLVDGKPVAKVDFDTNYIRRRRWDIIGRGLEICEQSLGYSLAGQKIDFRFEPAAIDSAVKNGPDH